MWKEDNWKEMRQKLKAKNIMLKKLILAGAHPCSHLVTGTSWRGQSHSCWYSWLVKDRFLAKGKQTTVCLVSCVVCPSREWREKDQIHIGDIIKELNRSLAVMDCLLETNRERQVNCIFPQLQTLPWVLLTEALAKGGSCHALPCSISLGKVRIPTWNKSILEEWGVGILVHWSLRGTF